MGISKGAGAGLVLQSLGIATAAAQVVTDGTMGPGGALAGPNYVIGEALGTRVGANLFHSFSDFNVLQGQSATFTSNFAGATDNVISRVTGGNASTINGLLRSEIAGADFWLINPNGLVFGAEAVLDVPAGFHASTADVLELADGGSFRATNPGASSLTIAPPSAFGFLDGAVGAIAVNGAALAVGAGESLSLVGGAIALQGGSLQARSGRVDLVSVASAGQVATGAAAGTAPLLTGFGALGAVLVDSGSNVDAGTVGAASGGTVAVVGATVDLQSGSIVSAGTSSTGDAGTILVEASERVSMSGGAVLSVESTEPGDAGGAGTIRVSTDQLDISGAMITAGTVDGSRSDGAGGLAGGSIELDVGTLRLEDQGAILAVTYGAGRGGDITILARDPDPTDDRPAIEIIDGFIRTATTWTGDAGSITLGSADAPIDFLWIHDADFDSPFHLPNGLMQGLFSDSFETSPNAGAAGEITVFANRVQVRDGTGMSASTVDGAGGRINLHVENLELVESGVINVSTSGIGDAGSITITGLDGATDRLVVAPGTPGYPIDSALSASSTATGPDAGAAGSISIQAHDVEVSGGLIGATTIDGAGGSVDLQVDRLHVTGGGIFATTSGEGDGGQVTIRGLDGEAAELVEMIGRGRISTASTYVNQETEGPGLRAGDAGDLFITAEELRLSSTDIITQVPTIDATTGDGAGGSIRLFVDTMTLDGGVIQAFTGGQGNAGTIVIRGLDGGAAGLVEMLSQNSVITTSTVGPVNFSPGDAGSIDIAARTFNMLGGSIRSTTPGDGAGGSVRIAVDDLLVDGPQTSINVSTIGGGNAGSIVIEGIDGAPARNVTVSGGAAILSDASFDPNFTQDFLGAAGSITIRALDVVLDGGTLSIDTESEGGGGVIDLGVDSLTIAGGGAIDARTSGFGDAGNIVIHGIDGGAATSIALSGEGSRISSASVGTGENAGTAGSIGIASGLVTVSDGASITGETIDGQGGSIALEVGTLRISGGAIRASTSGVGNAGSISIAGLDGGVADRVELEGFPGEIAASSLSAGEDGGDGGSIDIAAREVFVLDGSQITSFTSGGGDAGSIRIEVDDLRLLGLQSTIGVGTLGSGDAGNIVIDGIDGAPVTSVLLSGEGAAIRSDSSRIFGSPPILGAAGSISIRASALTLEDLAAVSVLTSGRAGGSIDLGVGTLAISGGARIIANTLESGDAGDISIHGVDGGRAGSVTVTGVSGEGHAAGLPSAIASDSTGTGPDAGDAGNISIAADSVRVTDLGVVSALTADGRGGSIGIEVGNLTIGNGGIVTTTTRGAGAGGSISIVADDVVLLDAGQLLADSSAAGASGSISVTADELRLENGAALSVRSTGAGRAGSVVTDLGSLYLIGNSQIDATATNSLAGNVELNVSELAFLQDSLISGLSADPENDGGNFIIRQPRALVLQRSSILANSASGAGGNISISADAIVIDTESTVEATGEVLTAGEVLGSVLQLDPPVVVDAAAALDTRCAAQQIEDRSSMVVRTTPPGAVREPYLPADLPLAPAACRP